MAKARAVPVWLPGASFFTVELFAFCFLSLDTEDFSLAQLWPLAFGGLWAALLGALLGLLAGRAARIAYGVTYFSAAVYAVAQTGYHLLFSEMLWLSDFRYAAEGSDYLDVLLSYPAGWWLGVAALLAQGVAVLARFPVLAPAWPARLLAAAVAVAAGVGATLLPQAVFLNDRSIRYAVSDYGRSQSAQAAYENMFNAHRLYQVCGLYQTLAKDVCANYIYPITPAYAAARSQGVQTVDAYFDARQDSGDNAMTGLLAGKNVILVLMESMDDWMIGAHTPTICRLMEEGLNFTSFYTPVYGGVRTFNTEFCVNTGSFLSSQGGYAFDYVTNTFDESLASLLTDEGYSAKVFHYNEDTFYSRGVFSLAMGYGEYVSYMDYEHDEDALYDDQLLFENQELREAFFREGPRLNFLITRSAHLSYQYNEVLSYWALKKYPQYRGLTGNEETDCAYLKARLVDDLFARLLEELEAQGELENTVIVGVTDHYTYGYKGEESLLALSGVEDALLLEKTPCFIWSAGLAPQEVDQVASTVDLLPTLLNLLGVDSPYDYLGSDIFSVGYDGFVPFSDGSWIYGDAAYDAGTGELLSRSGGTVQVSPTLQAALAERTAQFVSINNLILQTDYYGQ